MSSHVDGHPGGQATCDALLGALQAMSSDVVRKATASMCAFHHEGSANFAYLYHAKTKPRLDVYFPSTPDDRFPSDSHVTPLLRKTVTSEWARRFAWHFYLEDPPGSPSAARLLLGLPTRSNPPRLPQGSLVAEEVPDAQHVEGAVSQILVNRYERDRGARDACLRIHGTTCAGCGFDFGEGYGPDFAGLITVHHLVPLSQLKTEYVVTPGTDLVPLCPNCHLVVHQRVPPYTIEELRSFLAPTTDDGEAG